MTKFTSPRKIDLVPVSKEVISAREFLNLNKTRHATIKSATFIAPKIGGRGFGAFEVEYRTPKLVEA